MAAEPTPQGDGHHRSVSLMQGESPMLRHLCALRSAGHVVSSRRVSTVMILIRFCGLGRNGYKGSENAGLTLAHREENTAVFNERFRLAEVLET